MENILFLFGTINVTYFFHGDIFVIDFFLCYVLERRVKMLFDRGNNIFLRKSNKNVFDIIRGYCTRGYRCFNVIYLKYCRQSATG